MVSSLMKTKNVLELSWDEWLMNAEVEDMEDSIEKVAELLRKGKSNMPYIAPEVIEQARQIDLLTYLQNCEPHELVRISGNNYTTRTHDSLKISNGKWMWWSQRIGGYNALDYLVKVRGVSFVEAVETLMGKAAVMPTLTVRPKQEEKPKTLLLPEKQNDR